MFGLIIALSEKPEKCSFFVRSKGSKFANTLMLMLALVLYYKNCEMAGNMDDYHEYTVYEVNTF